MTAKGHDLDQIATSIQESIESANEALCDALEALDRAHENNGTDPETGLTADMAAKAYYKSLAGILRAFNAPGNWQRNDTPKVPLPKFVAFLAGTIIDDLVSGVLTPSIKKAFFGRGRPGIKAAQRRAIEAAVRYVEYARACPVTDAEPVKRVSEAFDVEEHTVRKWARKNPPDPILLSQQLPDKPESGAMLRRHMEENARLYRHSRHLKAKK